MGKKKLLCYFLILTFFAVIRADIPDTLPIITWYDTQKIKFLRPLWMVEHPVYDSVFLVLEQYTGKIHLMEKGPEGYETSLFYETKVSRAHNEVGMLCLAFHPDFVNNNPGIFPRNNNQADQKRPGLFGYWCTAC